MKKSLARQITELENVVEIERWEFCRLCAVTDDPARIEPALDRLFGEIERLASLREKAAVLSAQHIARKVVSQLMALIDAAAERRALAAAAPHLQQQLVEGEESDHATRFDA